MTRVRTNQVMRAANRGVAMPLVVVSLALATGCRGTSDTEVGRPIAGPSRDAAGDEVVALVDGEPVTAAEIDSALALPQYELERARYALRLERLEQVIAEKVLGPTVTGQAPAAAFQRAQRQAKIEVLLVPPLPPAVAVTVDDDPVRGNPNAPVTILEFADFQCPHSRRAEPSLRRLLDEYGERLRLVMRDFPRPFHRNARSAAEAAGCAAEQGRFWPFHDALFQNQDDLTRPALQRYAASTGLDVERFAACLDSGRFAAEVETDTADGARYGVRSTPTFFINGRYLKSADLYAEAKRLIDRALAEAGRTEPPGSAPADPTARPTPATPAGEPSPSPRPPSAIIELHRSRVDSALRDVPGLERQLERGALDVEGKRLLVVGSVDPGSLYELLGLRARDVLMQVDGNWVHDQQNPLWEALRGRGRVRLLVMREGYPQTFEYVIE